MLHAMIMAGGGGTRFWPRSRKRTAKQVLNVVGERSLIQATMDRLSPVIPPERLWVLTNEHLRDTVIEQLPEIPKRQILAEPAQRNTAPAIGLAAHILHSVDRDAVMGVFPADHIVDKPAPYRAVLKSALKGARDGNLMVIGIQPRWPETGYGYIQSGAPVAAGSPFATVAAFREKPDRVTAARYAADGHHLWNAGMFLFPPAVMLEELRKHAPEIAALLPALPARVSEDETALERFYQAAPSVSIDVAVMERSARALVVRAGFAWDDLGSWAALGEETGRSGNATRGRTLLLDSAGVVAFADGGMVAAVGAKDLVIAHTRDATLVCPKDRVQEVRDLVARLRAEPGGDAFL